jgi:Tuberculosis necrotizing toxin
MATEIRGAGAIGAGLAVGAFFIAAAILVNGCAQRNQAAREADAARILQAINTDPVQATKNLRFLVSAEVIGKAQRDRIVNTLQNTPAGRGPGTAAAPPGAQCPLPSTARADLKLEWLNLECSYRFPPNDGFAGTPKDETIAVGSVIDRYGRPSGAFLAPNGTSWEARALPYEQKGYPYHRYEVLKPLTVSAGTATSWFDQSGGGVQYRTRKSVQQLLDEGVLKEVAR